MDKKYYSQLLMDPSRHHIIDPASRIAKRDRTNEIFEPFTVFVLWLAACIDTLRELKIVIKLQRVLKCVSHEVAVAESSIVAFSLILRLVFSSFFTGRFIANCLFW